jgi:FtsZ-binding cell division protein ZapB
MRHPATSETVAADRAEIEGLRRENVLLRDQLQDVKQEREKWQQEADSWRQQATALLTDQRAKEAAEEPSAPRGIRAFLHRLTG